MDVAERTRQEELAVTFLDAGATVAVTGLSGSGRSTTLARIAGRLRDRGRRVVEVAGVRALGDAPFAALALAGIEVPTARSIAATAGELAATVGAQLATTGAVVVVDDADDLDQASVGVLVAAAARARAALLTGSRPGGTRRGDGPALGAQLPPGIRVRLEPLRHEDVHTLVQELLGGPVEAETLSAIALQSGGLPGLVAAMVRIGAATGALVDSAGTWRLVGEAWSPLLAQSLEPLLVDLGREAVAALEALAWSGAVSFDAAVARTGPDLLSVLADAGLTQVLDLGDESYVAVYPPLLAEHLRRDAPPVRRALAATRANGTAGGVVAATSVDPGSTPLLGQRYREHWTTEVARRWRVWEAGPTPGTAVPLVDALHQLAADEERVAEVFARTPADVGAPADRAALRAAHAVFLAATRGDVAAALDVLHDDDPAMEPERGYLHAAAAHVAFVAGRLPDADSLAPAPADSPRSLVAITAIRVELLLAQGATGDARAALRSFHTSERWFRTSSELSQGLLLVFEGRLADAVTSSRALLQAARERLDGPSIEAHSYVIALALSYSARYDELGAHLESVLSLPRPPTPQRHLRQGTLQLAALDALWRGHGAHARSLAARASALSAHPGPFPGMEPFAAVGIASILEADDAARAAHAEAIWAAALERVADGYVLHGVTLAVWVLEHWRTPERVALVAGWARDVQSPLVRALGRYVEALAADDASRLVAAADDLAANGLALHSLRARLRAVRCARRDGDARAGFLLAAQTWAQMEADGVGAAQMFAPLRADVDLTAREQELARLVAEGAANARIADELVLSVRTVENHLYNVFRKVGAESRDDLAAAVRTWLAPAGPRTSEG